MFSLSALTGRIPQAQPAQAPVVAGAPAAAAPVAPAAPATNTPLQQQQSEGSPMPPAQAAPNPAAPDPAANGQPAPQLPTPPQEPANPLDMLNKLWDTPPQSAAGAQAEAPAQPNFLQVDQSQLGEVTQSMNLSSSIPAELKARIDAGDPTATLEAMDFVAKQSYMQAMQHSTHLVSKQLEANQATHASTSEQQMQQMVNSSLTQQAIQDSPYAHPLLQRELTRVGDMVRTQYPDASPQWVAQQAQEYMKQLSGAFTGGAGDPTAPAPNQAPPINWEDWSATPQQ